jgi:hypothetical protein
MFRPALHRLRAAARAEAAGDAKFLVLALDLPLSLLPVDSERRVGEEVIERLVRELVLGKTVAELDVVGATVLVYLFGLILEIKLPAKFH